MQHVHAHFGTNSAEVAMLVHELGGPPWSFTVHGPEEFDKTGSSVLPEKIRRAAFVVAVSSFGRSQLFRSGRSHEHWNKIHVVRCGLEPAYFEAALERVRATWTPVRVRLRVKPRELSRYAASRLRRPALRTERAAIADRGGRDAWPRPEQILR